MFGTYCSGFMGLHGIGGLIVPAAFPRDRDRRCGEPPLVVLFNGRAANGKASDVAMNELRLRFVRGEITKEEFEKIKASL